MILPALLLTLDKYSSWRVRRVVSMDGGTNQKKGWGHITIIGL